MSILYPHWFLGATAFSAPLNGSLRPTLSDFAVDLHKGGLSNSILSKITEIYCGEEVVAHLM